MNGVALPAPVPFGRHLRRWRTQRGLTQLALALQSQVSARHLSWLEAGKAEPSRAMVLRLSAQLDLPLRERNAWLVAAGYAPLYRESALTDAAMAPALQAVQRLLDAHVPALALAVDRHWNLVAHNRMLPLLLQQVAPVLLQPPVNVLRASLHPQGLAPLIVNLPAWRAHVLARLQRQLAASGDAQLALLHDELQALPLPPGADGQAADAAAETLPPDMLAVPLVMRSALGRLNFITAVTVFGAPHDVTLAELAIETLLPADAETAARLQALHAAVRPA